MPMKKNLFVRLLSALGSLTLWALGALALAETFFHVPVTSWIGQVLNARTPVTVLVTLLAVCGPAATTITQLSQVHGRDAQYASAINVFSTLLCILTIPLMVLLYQL